MSAANKKGLTLIELMIVIAIIGIIAAIALPNLLRGRMQANEANAVAALKTYATAQVTFQTARLGTLATNSAAGARGFADNFRNLHYGNPMLRDATGDIEADTSKKISLIPQAFADANAATRQGFTAAQGAGAGRQPYQGYEFLEPKEMTPESFKHNAALLALPSKASETGLNAYWVDQRGAAYSRPTKADAVAASFIDIATPSSGQVTAEWLPK